MEPLQQPQSHTNTSIITGAVLGVIFSIFTYSVLFFAGTTVGMASILVTCLGCCLFAVMPGIVANHKYINDIGLPITVGKGAVIGVLSGVAFAVAYSLMDFVWLLFGINPTEVQMNYWIQILESFNMPEMDEAIRQMKDAQEQAEGATIMNVITGIFTSAIAFGLINVLSGMAASSILSRKFENRTI